VVDAAKKAHFSAERPCSVHQNILNKYRLASYARAVGFPVTNVDSAPSGRGHGNALDTNTKDLIQDFFERDDNSRLTSGKKQTATKNKIKKQKRLLHDTVVNMHEKFCAENPTNCISYAAFARLRPFWVRLPTSKDRDTCMCKRHANVQLMADKLFQLGVVDFKNCEDALQQMQICCDENDKVCMMRESSVCQDKHISFKESAARDDSFVVWSEWTTSTHEYQKDGQTKSTKLTSKSMKHGSVKEPITSA